MRNMAFWFYPVGVLIIGGIINLLKRDKVCEYCESSIYESERRKCGICGASRCHKCIVYEPFSKIPKYDFSENYCDVCCQNDKNYKNYQRALHGDQNKIEVFSARYKGAIPVTEKILNAKSGKYRDKLEALNELKFLALFLEGTILYDLNYHQDTDSEGNYIYSIWSATGIIAR